jgi:hypothetical protein
MKLTIQDLYLAHWLEKITINALYLNNNNPHNITSGSTVSIAVN